MGSDPGWVYGYVPSPAEWNNQFASKQDDLDLSVATVAALEAGINAAGGLPSLNSSAVLANVVYGNASSNLTAGYTATADAHGTVSSGTYTINQALGDYHAYTNNGAHTLAPPTLTSPANCASGVIEVFNGASAGAIATSPWTKVVGLFDTTAGHWFQCDYCITPRGSYLNIRAMQ
jgi:hypothetical protein